MTKAAQALAIDADELRFALEVRINRATNRIEVRFGERETCLSANAEQVREIALAMLRTAARLDGKII
jgi:hypothetical protein